MSTNITRKFLHISSINGFHKSCFALKADHMKVFNNNNRNYMKVLMHNNNNNTNDLKVSLNGWMKSRFILLLLAISENNLLLAIIFIKSTTMTIEYIYRSLF